MEISGSIANNSPYRRKQTVLASIPVADKDDTPQLYEMGIGTGEIVTLKPYTAAVWNSGRPRWQHVIAPVELEPWESFDVVIAEARRPEPTSIKIEEGILSLVSGAFFVNFDGIHRVNCQLFDGVNGSLPGRIVYMQTRQYRQLAVRYISELRIGEPFMRLTVCIENESWDSDQKANPPIAIPGLSIGFSRPALLKGYARAGAWPELTSDGVTWHLTNDSKESYLAPNQGRVWEFILPAKFNPFDMANLKDKGQEGLAIDLSTILAEWQDPLYFVPNIDQVRKTKAFWIGLGGPIKPSNLAYYQRRVFDKVSHALSADRYGPFGGHDYRGGFGDVKYASMPGTPRNREGSIWATMAIQTGLSSPLQLLIELAHGQALRPMLRSLVTKTKEELKGTYLWEFRPHKSSEKRWGFWDEKGPFEPYRKPLSPNIPDDWKKAHGWTAQDAQHIALEPLHDAWVICGDLWARQELQIYAKLIPVFWQNPPSSYPTANPYRSARAEGWMAVASWLAWSVTEDEALLNHYAERMNWLYCKKQEKPWPEWPEFGDYRKWPKKIWLSAPWQLAALAYGALAWGHDKFAEEIIADGYCKRAFDDEAKTGPFYVYNLEDPSDHHGDRGCEEMAISAIYAVTQKVHDGGKKDLCYKRLKQLIKRGKADWSQFYQLLPPSYLKE